MPTYRKRFGLRPDPAVAAEIASLDAERDCQRIVYLLSAYEFPWDFNRALELALFYTYASQPIATLLDRTGEFERHGQKRYDDTQLLVAYLLEGGYEHGDGAAALTRINRSHSHYRIAMDDFIFTLWTFIAFPIRWTQRWSARPMTAHEQQAWLVFWLEVGQRMGLTGLPTTRADFDDWVERYCQQHFVANPASARVAASTIAIMEAWLPGPLRSRVASVVYSLFDDDPRFLAAIGARAPTPSWRPLIDLALRWRARARRHWVLHDYPVSRERSRTRSYGRQTPPIDHLAPERLRRAEQRPPPGSGL